VASDSVTTHHCLMHPGNGKNALTTTRSPISLPLDLRSQTRLVTAHYQFGRRRLAARPAGRNGLRRPRTTRARFSLDRPPAEAGDGEISRV
jgi:hypothetical protein